MSQRTSGGRYNVYDVNRSARQYQVNVRHLSADPSPNIVVRCNEVGRLANECYFSVVNYQVDVLNNDIVMVMMGHILSLCSNVSGGWPTEYHLDGSNELGG